MVRIEKWILFLAPKIRISARKSIFSYGNLFFCTETWLAQVVTQILRPTDLVYDSPWQESRSREILEEKLFLVSPLELEKWNFMSRSPLDFQDFEKSFLFLLSVLKIFVLNFSFSSRFSRFCRTISLSPLDFQDFVEQFLFLLLIFKIL